LNKNLLCAIQIQNKNVAGLLVDFLLENQKVSKKTHPKDRSEFGPKKQKDTKITSISTKTPFLNDNELQATAQHVKNIMVSTEFRIRDLLH
jgi:hypothetical protein